MWLADSNRSFQAVPFWTCLRESLNSLRYQPTEDLFSVVSLAFQLWGTDTRDQPCSERWRWKRPVRASSRRKYQAPAISSRPAWPSRMSVRFDGASTTSRGVGAGAGRGGGRGLSRGGARQRARRQGEGEQGKG